MKTIIICLQAPTHSALDQVLVRIILHLPELRDSLKMVVTSSRTPSVGESSMESSSPMLASWAILSLNYAVQAPGRVLKAWTALY